MNNVVTVTVSGSIGVGKSAIAGIIENALKAKGVPVQYRDKAAAESEKNMTGAKWDKYIEMYRPMAVIVEKIDSPPHDPDYTITVKDRWWQRLDAAWSFTFGFRKLRGAR